MSLSDREYKLEAQVSASPLVNEECARWHHVELNKLATRLELRNPHACHSSDSWFPKGRLRRCRKGLCPNQ